MRELALHNIDIAENTISAAATQVRIKYLRKHTGKDRLTITIEITAKV